MMPLNKHGDKMSAWQFASAHHALNPDKCRPTLHPVTVLAGLARPAKNPEQTTMFEAV